MNRYFKSLLFAFGISLALVILSVVNPHTSIWLGVLPLLPLVAYHLVVLRPRWSQLRSAEIDSVYYFGFLITVSALAATAVEIARGGQGDHVESVLYKFGLGLLATGYAVIARLHLQSVAGADAPANPDQLLEQNIARSHLLLDNLDETLRRFGTLGETALTETQRVADTSRKTLEKAVLGAANTFETELRTALRGALEAVVGIRTLLTDTSFTAEREEFANTLRASARVSEELRGTLESLNISVRSGADVFQRAEGSVKSLALSAEAANTGLKSLSGEQGALVRIASNLEVAANQAHDAATAAQAAAQGVSDLSAKTSFTAASFGLVGHAADQAHQNLDGLATVCSRLELSVAKLAAALEAAGRFEAAVDGMNRGVAELAPHVGVLGREFDSLKGAMGRTASSLEGDMERSARAVGLLADNLAAVAQTIIDRTRERHAHV